MSEWTFQSLSVRGGGHERLPVLEPVEFESLPLTVCEPFTIPPSLPPLVEPTGDGGGFHLINPRGSGGLTKSGWCLVVGALAVVGTAMASVILSGALAGSSSGEATSATGTGVAIYSAMAQSGDAADADLEEVVHFVLSGMSAEYGSQHELRQGNGNYKLDILLFYRSNQAPLDMLPFNAAMVATLPSYYGNYPQRSGFGDKEGSSSCVCGNGQLSMMQLLYDDLDPLHRVSVVVHEYYHAIQMRYCGDTDDSARGPGTFVMWLSEGAASVIENLYVRAWFSNPVTNGWSDSLAYAVTQTVDSYAAGWRYSSALEAYDGQSSNYQAEAVAVLLLIKRYNIVKVLKTFVVSGECDLVTNGGHDAAFHAAFPLYANVQALYDEANAWLADPSRASVIPSDADLDLLFAATTLCGDSCATAKDGVCDASCLHGSDCTDCGAAAKPATWPVTLAPSYDRTG